jgi:hypothetical protein
MYKRGPRKAIEAHARRVWVTPATGWHLWRRPRRTCKCPQHRCHLLRDLEAALAAAGAGRTKARSHQRHQGRDRLRRKHVVHHQQLQRPRHLPHSGCGQHSGGCWVQGGRNVGIIWECRARTSAWQTATSLPSHTPNAGAERQPSAAPRLSMSFRTHMHPGPSVGVEGLPTHPTSALCLRTRTCGQLLGLLQHGAQNLDDPTVHRSLGRLVVAWHVRRGGGAWPQRSRAGSCHLAKAKAKASHAVTTMMMPPRPGPT